MQQAVAFVLALGDAAPGVPLEFAALHHPGTQQERFERLGELDCLASPDDLLLLLHQARGANTRGNANIFVRPDPSTAHPWLFLDDIPLPRLVSLCSSFAGLAVQTSPDQGQARLLAARPLDCRERGVVQRVLAARLRGDMSSTAGDKWGRLPGFTNRKRGKAGVWTNFVCDSTSSAPCIDPDPLLRAAAPAPGPVAGSLAPQGGRGHQIQPAAQPVAPATAQAGTGGYKADFAFCCHRLRAGWPADRVAAALADRALARGKRRTAAQAERYAAATLCRAQARLR